jgi:hypothetical protein
VKVLAQLRLGENLIFMEIRAANKILCWDNART